MPLANGCGQQGPVTGDLPLVRIGEQVISAGALQRFEETLPEYAKSSAPDRQARREHLQSLVDRHIMRLEAEKRGLEGTSALQQRLADVSNSRLVRAVLADSVDGRVEVTEVELKDAYERSDLGWQVWLAHILLATEEDAKEVVRALGEGADFSSLARERSLAEDANRGGDLRNYFNPGDIAASLRQPAFQLQVGEVSDPIQTIDGYEIIKIILRRRLSYEMVKGDLAKQVHQRKRKARAAEFLAQLKKRWAVRYHRDQAQTVLEGLERGGLLPHEKEAALVSYRGGMVRVGTFIETMEKLQQARRPADSLAVFQAVDLWVLPNTLLILVARAEGRDRETEWLAWKEEKQQELMLDQLYKGEISSRVSVDEEETRRHYEQQIDTYTSLPGPIRLTEVLVDTEEEAREILGAARAGESLEVLALQHSRRTEVEPVGGHAYSDSGHMRIEVLFQSPYRDFLGDENHKDVGVVQGPIPVQGMYSVFRLDSPIELTPIPYPQIRQPIRHRLRKRKEAVLFDGFIDSLRDQYAGQTQWLEDNLDRVAVAK